MFTALCSTLPAPLTAGERAELTQLSASWDSDVKPGRKMICSIDFSVIIYYPSIQFKG